MPPDNLPALCCLPYGGYRYASCGLVSEVDSSGDVDLHLLCGVTPAPHDPPEVLCQWIGVHLLVEFGEIFRQGVLVLSDAECDSEEVHQR